LIIKGEGMELEQQSTGEWIGKIGLVEIYDKGLGDKYVCASPNGTYCVPDSS
jgi:hypothetical protein